MIGGLAALCLLVTAGCLSSEQLEEIRAGAAESRAAANAFLQTADELEAEIDGLVDDYRAMQADAEQSEEAREAARRIADEIERKQADYDRWMARAAEEAAKVDGYLAELEEAETGWDVAEVGVTVLAGFVPGAAAMLPIVRRLRRQFDGTVSAIAAGGGPRDPERTKAAMLAQPGLKAAVTKARHRVGDKA